MDCLISNCVINLAPDKPAVFREMFRVLKPGGRLAVSDIALKKPLPPEWRQDILAYVGCIAGAIFIAEYDAASGPPASSVQIIDSRQRPQRLRPGGKPVGLLLASDARPFAAGCRCNAAEQSTTVHADLAPQLRT